MKFFYPNSIYGWSYSLVKSNQSVEYVCHRSNGFSTNKWKWYRMKMNDIKRHFSGRTRKINLSYLLWKPSKLPKSSFSSRIYFVKLSPNRKKLICAKKCSRNKGMKCIKLLSWTIFNFTIAKSYTWEEKLAIRLIFYLPIAVHSTQFILFFNFFLLWTCFFKGFW